MLHVTMQTRLYHGLHPRDPSHFETTWSLRYSFTVLRPSVLSLVVRLLGFRHLARDCLFREFPRLGRFATGITPRRRYYLTLVQLTGEFTTTDPEIVEEFVMSCFDLGC